MSEMMPWWAWLALYTMGSAFFGGLNNQIQRRRCLKETDCERGWNDLDKACGHLAGAACGYFIWPILLPASVLYELARGTTLKRLTGSLEARRATARSEAQAKIRDIEQANRVLADRNRLLEEQARLEKILPGNRDDQGLPLDS